MVNDIMFVESKTKQKLFVILTTNLIWCDNLVKIIITKKTILNLCFD
jgi:hypothetical protein